MKDICKACGKDFGEHHGLWCFSYFERKKGLLTKWDPYTFIDYLDEKFDLLIKAIKELQ